MASPVDLDAIRIVLLDIEGTTTPLAFVRDTLYSWARQRLQPFLAAIDNTALGRLAEGFAAERQADVERAPQTPPWDTSTSEATVRSCAAYAGWLMDRDAKSPALSALQGLIWDEGLRAGQLRGYVYDDVPLAMRRWRRMGRRVAIYSSGSELTQRQLFASTEHGDLTPLVSGFFDTAVGAKTEPGSYHRIAAALACQPADILFISDATGELDAATAAGCATLLALRPGNPPQPAADRYGTISSLATVLSPLEGDSAQGSP